MDRPSGLYTEGERAEWATLQAVPVYRDMIQNSIEISSFQAVSQCPTALAGRADAGFNLGLLNQELPGYLWFEALTSPTNWAIAGGLILAVISVLLHVIQHCRSLTRTEAADTRTAVGVTITNTQEPAPRRDCVPAASPMIAVAQYGIADVVEAIEMALVTAVWQRDKYGAPLPLHQ